MDIDHEGIFLNFHMIFMTVLFRLITLLKFLIKEIDSKGHNGVDGVTGIKRKLPEGFSFILNRVEA
jgi:hypothetical protein